MLHGQGEENRSFQSFVSTEKNIFLLLFAYFVESWAQNGQFIFHFKQKESNYPITRTMAENK